MEDLATPVVVSSQIEPMADFVRRELRMIASTTQNSSRLQQQDTNLFHAAANAAELSLFSSRRPKHALAGAASATKNVVKGVGAGAACLFAAPAIGAKIEGLPGLAKGLAVGSAAAVALPIVGLATGVRQLARGILSTPEAIKHGTGEATWNPYYREWVCFYLASEHEAVLRLTEADFLAAWREEQEWMLIDDQGECCGNDTVFPVEGCAPEGSASPVPQVRVVE